MRRHGADRGSRAAGGAPRTGGRARRGRLRPAGAARPRRRRAARALAGGWHQVEAGDAVREAAIRFLRVHPLCAADALQLAAAFIAADRQPSSLELVTLDDRLAAAARKEGFVVIAASPSA